MPARGDRKPCTHTGCAGTMWFGRDVVAHVVGPMRQEGKERWLCDQRASHDAAGGGCSVFGGRYSVPGIR